MEIPIWGLITGLIILLGGVSTSVALLGKLMSKAAREALQQKDIDDIKTDLKNYVRKEVHDAMKNDVEGIGRKVQHLQIDHNKVSDKVISLESKVLTKLENIENLLSAHIADHNRGKA